MYAKTLDELREKEELIKKDLADGIIPNDLTVYQLVELYLEQKKNIKEKTRNDYKSALKTLGKETFARIKIDAVKAMDAKDLFVKLQNENGMGYSNINRMREILKPAFQMAYANDMIRKSPFQFNLSDVIRNDSKKREAITENQMEDFLSFVLENGNFQKYYNGIYVLFHTGLRISELCGLTKKDIDFKCKGHP